MNNDKTASINIIDILYTLNIKMYKMKIINHNEYNKNNGLFTSVLSRDLYFSKQQISLINSTASRRLCVTKFRFCIIILRTNLN